MNTLTKIIIVLSVLLFFIPDIYATGIKNFTKDDLKLDDEDVYWYFVRIRIDSKKKQYQIIGTGSKLMTGTKKEFSKAIWWGVARRQVAIGPFYTEEEALNSRMYYQRSRDKINEVPAVEPPETIHWFQMTLIELNRIGAYQFTRSPAAVNSGSTNSFLDALFEGLLFEKLSIGPYWDYTRAEEAKAIYRLNE